MTDEEPEFDDLLADGMTTGPTCRWCGGRWTFATADRTGPNTPPAGHTVHRTPDGSTYDTCPREGDLRMPPGGPLTI